MSLKNFVEFKKSFRIIQWFTLKLTNLWFYILQKGPTQYFIEKKKEEKSNVNDRKTNNNLE